MRFDPNMSLETRRLGRAIAPLTRAEIKRGVAAAVEYLTPELTRDGQSRYRVLGAELSLTRPSEKDMPVRRRIEVLIVDYLGRRQVRIALERGRVVEVRPLEGQPAYAADEVAEATSLARGIPALRAIARRRGVFASPFVPGSCDPATRRVGLRFVQSRGKAPAIVLAAAEVDLIERRLMVYEVYPAGELVADV